MLGNLLRQNKFTQDNLDIVGVLDGRRAFIGPEHVVIDLTNKCDNRCIGCWTYSPLLKDKEADSNWGRQELPTDIVKELINDLERMGTKRIRFTGGGEPFLHPDITDLISYVKQKGMTCAVTTGFTTVTEEIIKRLVILGLDDLAVSLWAADADTYVKTHPSKTKDTFRQIRDRLMLLSSLKNDKPRLLLCNVILNLNYHQIEQMLDFALEVGANAIYFTLVDTIEDRTDSLLLFDQQRIWLKEKVIFLKQKIEKQGENYIELENIDNFLDRISESHAKEGRYDFYAVDKIPCYIGWMFSRILANGDVSPCCRGVNLTMGNIKEQSFEEIWYGAKQNEFRFKAKTLKKSAPYFINVNCYKTCDNLIHNQNIHNRITSLSKRQIDLLKNYKNNIERLI